MSQMCRRAPTALTVERPQEYKYDTEDSIKYQEAQCSQNNVIEIPRWRPPEFSDEALALRFADRYARELRYVAMWGRWFVYDGTKWCADETLASFNKARQICREAAAGCEEERTKVAVVSAKTVAAVERLARCDRRLAATIEQWDADLWLLNTPDGTWDLRTGSLLPHDPNDYCTKITSVSADGDCPLFIDFLEDITDGDQDLIAYLQRVLGYCLTGGTKEHAMFFGYGTGSNGKGVLVSTTMGVLGDYAKVTPIETFTASLNDRHPTELADLRGARLVTASETEEGRRWAEAKIKMLTGGDKISARFMRQDFFQFVPQFKLFITGNHKPGLRSVDEAIRRRFHLVPFGVTIPKDRRDPDLPEKLKAEWPGILRWAIAGCLEWQRIGLQTPAAVRDATEAYLAAEDAVASWIDDCCEDDPQAWTSSAALFGSWCVWAGAAGEILGSAKNFGQKLETRGYMPKRGTGGARGFQGLRLVEKLE